MPINTTGEAIDRLIEAVEQAQADDLAEIYTELYPDRQAPDATGSARSPLIRQIVDHIRQGIEPEEVIDLWNVIYPEDRNEWSRRGGQGPPLTMSPEPRYAE